MAKLNWNKSRTSSLLGKNVKAGSLLMMRAGSKNKIISPAKGFNQPPIVFTPRIANLYYKEEPANRYAKPWTAFK